MNVGPPATRTDEYLAAILDELRALRVAVEGGGGPQVDADPPGVAELLADAAVVPVTGPPVELGRSARPPAKRTRHRPARQN